MTTTPVTTNGTNGAPRGSRHMRNVRARALAWGLLASSLLAAGAVSALGVAGCSSSSDAHTFDSEQDAAGGRGDAEGTDPGFLPDDAGDAVEPVVDAEAPAPEPVVYAHSSNMLYKIDTNTNDVSLVAPFKKCTGEVIDLALDKDSNAFVTTFNGLYRLDLATATCTLVKEGTYPNSLSFVPVGTLDPAVEALVGYSGSTYVRIDTSSGKISNVGSLGGGLSSSGDIVSVIGGGTFLTVRGANCSDCLIQVDPKTGDMLKNFGGVSHADVYGLAYWGATLYGFSAGGEVFVIKWAGSTLLTADLVTPSGQDIEFYGAGSTTSAPPADKDGGTIPIVH